MRPNSLEKFEAHEKEDLSSMTDVHERLYSGGIQRMLVHFRKMDEMAKKKEEEEMKNLVFKPTISKPPRELNLPPFLERIEGQRQKREKELEALREKVEKEREDANAKVTQTWTINERSRRIALKNGHKGPIKGYKEHVAIREAIKNTTEDDIKYFSEKGEGAAFVNNKIGKMGDTTIIDLNTPERPLKSPLQQKVSPKTPKTSAKKACIRLYNYGADLKMKKEEARAHREMLLDMGIDPETGKKLHTPIVHESPESMNRSQGGKDISRYEMLYNDFEKSMNKKGTHIENEIEEMKKTSTPQINKSLIINKTNKDVQSRYMEEINDPKLREKRIKELEKQIYSTPKTKTINLNEHMEGINKSLESYKEKNKKLKEMKESLDLQGCTFEPNINNNPKLPKPGENGQDGSGVKKRKRNDEVFEKIYRQGQEKKMRMEKLEMEHKIKKEEELKECTFKPASASKSKILGSIDYVIPTHNDNSVSNDDLLAGLREVRNTLLGGQDCDNVYLDSVGNNSDIEASIRSLHGFLDNAYQNPLYPNQIEQSQLNLKDLLVGGNGYQNLNEMRQDFAIESILNENVPNIADLLDNKNTVGQTDQNLQQPITGNNDMFIGSPSGKEQTIGDLGKIGLGDLELRTVNMDMPNSTNFPVSNLDIGERKNMTSPQPKYSNGSLHMISNNTIGTETPKGLLSDLVEDLV